MRGAALLALAALAACGSPSPAPSPQPNETAATPGPAAATPSPTATPATPAPVLTPLPQPTRDLSVLESRDCRAIAQAYFEAIGRRDFTFAARVWNDPVIDDARLKALFHGYKQPAIAISGLDQEGAAGSSYCTVTGTLSDAGDPTKAQSVGEIVLKRVNDVPGATPAQLRWTIRSSTFVEKMQRTG